MSEEEKKVIYYLKTRTLTGLKSLKLYYDVECLEIVLNLVEKQQKLINILIHNEAVKEGKDFNEIKERYYECL